MASRTILIDRGWRRIRRDTEALQGEAVKVGFMAGGPSQDGVTIVDYATYNEFGTSNIPSRPFMRRTADEAEKPIRGFASALVGRVIMGNLNIAGVMNSLGLWYQARIRATIRSSRGWAVPLAASTIKAKGSTQPLIDHGILIGAVSYERTRL